MKFFRSLIKVAMITAHNTNNNNNNIHKTIIHIVLMTKKLLKKNLYLKMIHFLFIILMDLFREERNRIPDKKMGHVLGHKLVNLTVDKLIIYLFIIYKGNIIVSENNRKKQKVRNFIDDFTLKIMKYK